MRKALETHWPWAGFVTASTRFDCIRTHSSFQKRIAAATAPRTVTATCSTTHGQQNQTAKYYTQHFLCSVFLGSPTILHQHHDKHCIFISSDCANGGLQALTEGSSPGAFHKVALGASMSVHTCTRNSSTEAIKRASMTFARQSTGQRCQVVVARLILGGGASGGTGTGEG